MFEIFFLYLTLFNKYGEKFEATYFIGILDPGPKSRIRIRIRQNIQIWFLPKCPDPIYIPRFRSNQDTRIWIKPKYPDLDQT